LRPQIDSTLARRFPAQALACPSESPKITIPAILKANLRVDKTSPNPHCYEEAKVTLLVFDQALVTYVNVFHPDSITYSDSNDRQ
jgi:hypothetical protein